MIWLGLLALDLIAKWWALESVPPLEGGAFPFGGIPLFDGGAVSFSLNLVTNTGAAWGLFQNFAGPLFVVRLIILAALLGYLFFSSAPKRSKIPLWLVAVGATGNAFDYCLYGHVIDFFHFRFWGHSFPLFNFADAYICVGVALLCLFPQKKAFSTTAP